ncbi:hypothetical protein [Paraburkholderia acidiphila]|uniref:Uncharacterized protein n=1 Tax=Paraburkholderia acidiphila TaxID=2571747 RepID=A0A7Z2JAA9_9BURK|nr:hypothetical protein [Paraburkholderia acidiphila]QGZ56543.1 hypothetical protein FAZ97_16325 [Paraburkholderia acidiphila]
MMSNDASNGAALAPGVRPLWPKAGRQPDFALSRVDFIFEIAISSKKSGTAMWFGEFIGKSMR